MTFANIRMRELLRFLVGGGSAVITDYVSYQVFLFVGIDVIRAKALSFVLGSIVGFVINKYWTFERKHFSFPEILKYIFLYAITASINTLVNTLVLNAFAVQFFAFLCATGVSTVLNFLGQKFYVFRMKGYQ